MEIISVTDTINSVTDTAYIKSGRLHQTRKNVTDVTDKVFVGYSLKPLRLWDLWHCNRCNRHL